MSHIVILLFVKSNIYIALLVHCFCGLITSSLQIWIVDKGCHVSLSTIRICRDDVIHININNQSTSKSNTKLLYLSLLTKWDFSWHVILERMNDSAFFTGITRLAILLNCFIFFQIYIIYIYVYRRKDISSAKVVAYCLHRIQFLPFQ